jgi:hypothetical protein
MECSSVFRLSTASWISRYSNVNCSEKTPQGVFLGHRMQFTVCWASNGVSHIHGSTVGMFPKALDKVVPWISGRSVPWEMKRCIFIEIPSLHNPKVLKIFLYTVW